MTSRPADAAVLLFLPHRQRVCPPLSQTTVATKVCGPLSSHTVTIHSTQYLSLCALFTRVASQQAALFWGVAGKQSDLPRPHNDSLVAEVIPPAHRPLSPLAPRVLGDAGV